MDKITMEFTSDEIRKLLSVCLSGMVNESYGTKAYDDAFDFFCLFYKTLKWGF